MIPSISNKTSLILIGISILLAIAGFIMSFLLPENYWVDILFNAGSIFGQFFGLVLLIRNGSIMNTAYWRIISFFIGILIVGLLFKIQHWVGSGIILMVGAFGIAVVYAIRFFHKKKIDHLDILKLLWVLAYGIGTPLFILHLIPRELIYISSGLLWLTIIDFIIIGFTTKTIFNEPA